MESFFAYITSLVSTFALLAAAPLVGTPLDANQFSSTQFSGGIVPITAAHHSFAVAADASGTLYFTEYTRGRLVRFNLASSTSVSLAVSAAKAYALTVAPDGTRYMTIDGEGKTGALRSISSQGVVKDVMSNLTRPRGVSVGSDGKIYVALEADNKLVSYDPVSKKTEDTLTGVVAPQAVIYHKGLVYWLERGTFSPQGEPLTPGKIRVKEMTGITKTLVDGIWNPKSMVLRADGSIMFVSESNKQLQGNSGYIAQYNIEKHEVSLIRGGLDYPQSPTSVGAVVYTTLARDNLLVAITNEETRAWPGLTTSMLYEGSITEEGEEGTDPFFIPIEGASTPLVGGIKNGAAGAVRGWFRLATSEVSIDRKEIAYGTIDVPTSGTFKVPTISCKRESGAACAITIIPERKRLNARWPLWYDAKKREWPQKNFDESPLAYWFYIDSNPKRDAESRTWSQLAPSLQRFVQRHIEGLYGRKPNSYDEVVSWFANSTSNSLDCKGISQTFLQTEEWKKITTTLTEEQVGKTLYRGLLGIEVDSLTLAKTLDAHKKGASWETVGVDLMKTTQYQSLCGREWY